MTIFHQFRLMDVKTSLMLKIDCAKLPTVDRFELNLAQVPCKGHRRNYLQLIFGD